MTENSATPVSDGKANFSIATRSTLLPLFPICDGQGKKSGLHYRKEDVGEAWGDKTLGILESEFPMLEGGCGISQSGSF